VEFDEEKESRAVLLANKHFSIQNCVKKYNTLSERVKFPTNEYSSFGILSKVKVKFSWVIVFLRTLKYKLTS